MTNQPIQKFDSLELIKLGKELQVFATSRGVRCPQFTTAFGIRIASKIVAILDAGPRPSKEQKDQTIDDLYLFHKIIEGERAEMFSKLCDHLDKLIALADERKVMSSMEGIPVYSDANFVTVNQARDAVQKAKRMDPTKIR